MVCCLNSEGSQTTGVVPDCPEWFTPLNYKLRCLIFSFW